MAESRLSAKTGLSVSIGIKFASDMKVKLKTVSVKVSVASSKPLSKYICF